MTLILPALAEKEQVILDFSEVNFVTQSFMHALIGEALKRYGENVLDEIVFHKCNAQVKSIVSLVVDYSLGGFEQPIEDGGKGKKKTKNEKGAVPKRVTSQ